MATTAHKTANSFDLGSVTPVTPKPAALLATQACSGVFPDVVAQAQAAASAGSLVDSDEVPKSCLERMLRPLRQFRDEAGMRD